LSKINSHYAHRRALRKQKMVLRYGEVIHLTARDSNFNYIGDVVVFARYSLFETIIIATNMTDEIKKFCMDLSNLLPTFKKMYGNNTVVMTKNMISDAQGEPEYYFLREFVELGTLKSLPPYRSMMISV